MRRLLFGITVCVCAAVSAADGVSTNSVRNPFWPKGYTGERKTTAPGAGGRAKSGPAKAPPALTAAEKKKLEAEKAAAEKAAKEAAEKAAREKAEKEAAARAEAERKRREITGAHWDAARAALRFGGRVKVREGDVGDVRQASSVVINGKVYADGDLVSMTHDSRRFTWRIEGLSDKNKLKLVRLRAKYLEQPGAAGKNSDKGANP